MKCADCRHSCRLKIFELGKGHREALCCTLLEHDDDGFILHVYPNDYCEAYGERGEANEQETP